MWNRLLVRRPALVPIVIVVIVAKAVMVATVIAAIVKVAARAAIVIAAASRSRVRTSPLKKLVATVISNDKIANRASKVLKAAAVAMKAVVSSSLVSNRLSDSQPHRPPALKAQHLPLPEQHPPVTRNVKVSVVIEGNVASAVDAVVAAVVVVAAAAVVMTATSAAAKAKAAGSRMGIHPEITRRPRLVRQAPVAATSVAPRLDRSHSLAQSHSLDRSHIRVPKRHVNKHRRLGSIRGNRRRRRQSLASLKLKRQLLPAAVRNLRCGAHRPRAAAAHGAVRARVATSNRSHDE